MENVDKDLVLSRIREVIFNFFPEFKSEYRICARRCSNNCIIIETIRESEKKDFYFSLSLVFKNSEEFNPSLCCIRESVFNSRPGKTIHLHKVEEGIGNFFNTLNLPNSINIGLN